MRQVRSKTQTGWAGLTTKTGQAGPMTQTGWGPDEPDDLDNPYEPGCPNFEIHPNLAELTSTKIWCSLHRPKFGGM